MNFSKDWNELIGAFQKNNVEFLLVGGHAVTAYGYARTTSCGERLVLALIPLL